MVNKDLQIYIYRKSIEKPVVVQWTRWSET